MTKIKSQLAVKSDIIFILKGIKEICLIEKQKSDPDKKLIQLTNLALKRKEIIIIKENDKSIGFIQFKFTKKSPYGIEYGDYSKKYCWIDWLYIDKNHRRKGYGTFLNKLLVSKCKKERIKEIRVDVFQINKVAKLFYKKIRFNEEILILQQKIK